MTDPSEDGAVDGDLELTVWFDGDCGLCRRVARWLEEQPKYVALRCVSAQGAAARGTCPLDLRELLASVTVTASDGAVYRGSNAWLICLWALRDYREWSLSLSSRLLRPLADRMFGVVAGLASLTRRQRARS